MDPLARLASLEGVASAMAAARDGIDAMLRDRGLVARRPRADRPSRCCAGRTPAPCSRGRTRRSTRGAREGGEHDGASAAVRVSTELLGLAPTLARVTAAGARPAAHAGGEGRASADDAARAVRATTSAPRRLQRPRPPAARADTTRPALVVAAVAHAEVAHRWRRSRRTTASSPAPPSAWCSSPAASTRTSLTGPRSGSPRACDRSTSRTCAATATAGGRGARVAAVRRRGLCGRGRGEPAQRPVRPGRQAAPHMQAAPRSRNSKRRR